MSDFFFIKTKAKISKKNLYNHLSNLKTPYVKNNKCIKILKIKKQNYYFGISSDLESKKVIKVYKDFLILYAGKAYNLISDINKKEDLEIDIIFREYFKNGLPFFKNLDGNFSILIFNQKKDSITFIRDRYGSNISFYINKKNFLSIFSKIKIFKNSRIFKLLPNWEIIKLYIFKNYRYSYGLSESFFKDVLIFKPNSITIFNNKQKISYKNLFNFKTSISSVRKLNDVKRNFISILKESLKERFLPVKKKSAFLLSGGLDSPTIASLASSAISEKIKTFSICYNQNSKSQPKTELFYDESKLIRKIIKKNNFQSHFLYPNALEFKKTFKEMLIYHDEPISSPTWYSHFLLCKKLYMNNIKFVFGGDGGDHLLAGLYDDIPYFFADLKINKKNKLLKNEIKCWINLHDHPIFPKNHQILKKYFSTCFDWNKKGKIINYTWDEELMRSQKTNGLLLHKKFFNKKIFFSSLSKSYLKSKMLQDMLYTSSPASTRAEVVNFSTFGLQCRSAFLSNKFVNFCLSLPIEYMIKNGYTKWLIRYSMKDYLPKVVLWKKEHVGLNAPANIWFRSELKNELIKKIKSLCFRKEVNFINRKVLDNIMQDHFSKKNDHMMFLWKLYSLESWLLKWKF